VGGREAERDRERERESSGRERGRERERACSNDPSLAPETEKDICIATCEFLKITGLFCKRAL